MSRKDVIDLHGCVIKDADGVVLAELTEDEFGRVTVNRCAACSLGMYLYIISYLKDLGVKLK